MALSSYKNVTVPVFFISLLFLRIKWHIERSSLASLVFRMESAHLAQGFSWQQGLQGHGVGVRLVSGYQGDTDPE